MYTKISASPSDSCPWLTTKKMILNRRGPKKTINSKTEMMIKNLTPPKTTEQSPGDRYPLIIDCGTRKGICWHVTSAVRALSLTCTHMRGENEVESFPATASLIHLFLLKRGMDADQAMARARVSCPHKALCCAYGSNVPTLLTVKLWRCVGRDKKCDTRSKKP